MNDFKETFSFMSFLIRVFSKKVLSFKRGALSTDLLSAMMRRFARASEERLRSLKPLVNLMLVTMVPALVSFFCCCCKTCKFFLREALRDVLLRLLAPLLSLSLLMRFWEPTRVSPILIVLSF